MKIKLLIVVFAMLILGVYSASAQTIHTVNAGDETLGAAVAAAADGDIIELVDSGGLYTISSSDKIAITKTLTIRAAAGMEQKPIVRNINAGASSARLFEIQAGGNLTLIGLDLDGRMEDGGAAHAKNIVRNENVAQADSFAADYVKIYGCLMHDVTEVFVKGHAYTRLDTVIVNNSLLYNCGREAIIMRESEAEGSPDVKYIELENCTFANVVREAMYTDFNNPVIRINHCTFDQIGTGNGDRILYLRDAQDAQIKNSIFTNQGAYSDAIRIYGTSTISYCDTFNVGEIDLEESATVGDQLLGFDPLYTDPANLDYTLQPGSPVLGMADDGFAMGDLRWDPTAQGPKVHQIEAGTDIIQPVINIAEAGDILELVTSGGLYLSNDQIELTKDVIIRAREGLAQKPILKYVGTSTSAYMFKVETSARVEVRSLEFDGDGTAEGGAAKAKYALRLDNADTSGTMQVLVEDCVMHDFEDKMIKPYPDCGIDSLLVRNSIFYNGAREGITLYSGSSGDPAVRLKYAEIVNCTFSGIVREAIKGDTNPNTVLRVDHCTIYDCGGSSKGMLYVDDLLDVEIKNSIFVKSAFADNFVRLESDANSFHHNVVFDVANWEVDNSSTVSDTIHADPMFADAANMNFTLAGSSPARTAGEGGTPAGDLRWAIDPNSVLLTVITEGKGIVQLDPPGGVYSPGTVVTLTAVPDPGWQFVSWEGVLVFPPNNPVATITMDSDKTVKAIFESTVPKVTLTVDTLGYGHVELNPEPVDGVYEQGTSVTITAVPQTNWKFVEWLGDVTGMVNPVTFAVDSNMQVTASFASVFTQFTLNVETSGLGSVTQNPAPILGTYDTSKVVVLTAFPAQGWQFSGWSGDLIGTGNPDSVTMDSDKNVIAAFTELTFERRALEIDTTWDLYDAVQFANNNSFIDSLILITSGGLYTSRNTEDVAVTAPLTIVAAPGLAEKPIITNSDPEASNLDVFRVFDDFTIVGVVMDGGHEKSHGMKYGIRLSHYTGSDSVKNGANIIIMDCDFKDFFEAKDPNKDGHAFKIDVGVLAGTVRIENSTFANFGYEAIRISDTEKWLTDRALDSLIVKNCTFTNIDAECVRYYSDLDPATPDAPVVIEHITVNNSATRVFYLKNSGGAIVRDVIVANSRMSNHGRDDDLMDAQGNGDFLSYTSHIDTFNVRPVPIKATDAELDEATVWGIDPKFEDAANMNYTLLPESHLYGLAHDEAALGDLRWATNQPTHVMLTVLIEGNGDVMLDPMPVGKTYDPNTVVTLTAVPDSGYFFAGWSGDLTGETNPETITLTQAKNVTATFKMITGVTDQSAIPTEYNLGQNYPNPFNPSTTISFDLKQAGRTTLVVYDMLGRVVATLVDKQMDAGRYSIKFQLPELVSGVYFYRIKSGEFESIKKMIMVK